MPARARHAQKQSLAFLLAAERSTEPRLAGVGVDRAFKSQKPLAPPPGGARRLVVRRDGHGQVRGATRHTDAPLTRLSRLAAVAHAPHAPAARSRSDLDSCPVRASRQNPFRTAVITALVLANPAPDVSEPATMPVAKGETAKCGPKDLKLTLVIVNNSASCAVRSEQTRPCGMLACLTRRSRVRSPSCARSARAAVGRRGEEVCARPRGAHAVQRRRPQRRPQEAQADRHPHHDGQPRPAPAHARTPTPRQRTPRHAHASRAHADYTPTHVETRACPAHADALCVRRRAPSAARQVARRAYRRGGAHPPAR
eukprot:2626089-Prymnesium_polylepis.1